MNLVQVSIAAAFGLNVPASLTVPGFASDSSVEHLIPTSDPNYRFRVDSLRDVLGWHEMTTNHGADEGLALIGPTGCGKTSIIREVASRLNIPVHIVNGHARFEVKDLFGGYVVIGGDTLFQDGPGTTAYREGHWLLINEVDLIDPGEAAGLNTFVERSPFTLAETGEVLRPHPNFRIIVTANTNFGGDSSGLYQGTSQQNLALGDRFFLTEVDYASEQDEMMILEKVVPALPPDIRQNMVRMANEVRKLFKGEDASGPSIEIPFSTRALVRWARTTLFFSDSGVQTPVIYALDRSLAFRAQPETRTALHEIAGRIFV